MRESGNSRFLGFGLGVRLQIWRMWIRESGGRERILLCVGCALCGAGEDGRLMAGREGICLIILLW